MASREPSDTPPVSQLPRTYRLIRHNMYNSTVFSGFFQASLPAQSTPLGESLDRTNKRDSKTSIIVVTSKPGYLKLPFHEIILSKIPHNKA